MGQYQQWLHYQEVDQQLRSRLEQLETELTLLQAQAPVVEEEEVNIASSDNMLVQALLAYNNAKMASTDVTDVPYTKATANTPGSMHVSEMSAEAPSTHYFPEESLPAPVSPALLAWSRLYLDSQKMPVPSLDTKRPATSSSSTESDLLPQDMATFLNRHTPVVPQPRPPAWLENAFSAPAIPDQLPNNPIDQQTLRMNRRVERWLERWRKTSPSSQEQQEDQEDESHR
jgi:hypothetical protein